MRHPALLLVLVLLVAVCAWPPAAADADSGSISKDARGPQPSGDYGPLGSPPTPSLYVLGQTTIFAAGLTLLVVAAALGIYTVVLSRRSPPRR